MKKDDGEEEAVDVVENDENEDVEVHNYFEFEFKFELIKKWNEMKKKIYFNFIRIAIEIIIKHKGKCLFNNACTICEYILLLVIIVNL